MPSSTRSRFRPSLEINPLLLPALKDHNDTLSPVLTPLTSSSTYSENTGDHVITPYNPHKSFELDFWPSSNAGDFFFTFERPYSALKRTVLECDWEEEHSSPSIPACSPTLGFYDEEALKEEYAIDSSVGPTPPPKTPPHRGQFLPETEVVLPHTPELDYFRFEHDSQQSPSEATTPLSTPPAIAQQRQGLPTRPNQHKFTHRSASSLLSPIPILLDTIPEDYEVPVPYTKQLPDRPLRSQPLPALPGSSALPSIDLHRTHYTTTTTTTSSSTSALPTRPPRTVNTRKLQQLLGPVEDGISLCVLPFNFTVPAATGVSSARHANRLYEMI